jgi:hypothetical protein
MRHGFERARFGLISTTLILASFVACDPRLTEASPGRLDAPASPARGSASDPDERQARVDRYVGTFRYVGGVAQREALEAAIDDVVSEMNPLTRSIARSRLKATNPIPSEVRVSRTEGLVFIAFDDRSHTCNLDGSKTKTIGITGDELDYHLELKGTRMRQVFVGDRGGRSNAFSLGAEGKLTVSVEVTSPQLPKSLAYTLTFRAPR